MPNLEAMPSIIAEQMVKPAEKIDSDQDPPSDGHEWCGWLVQTVPQNGGTPVNQALDSVLGMALQMPAMQALGKELGISLENGVAGVTDSLVKQPEPSEPAKPVAAVEVAEAEPVAEETLQ